jgi:hypothetical protein
VADLIRLGLLLLAGLCLAYVGFAVGRRAERADYAIRHAGRLLGRRP